MRLNIYVPKCDNLEPIALGSAIVGSSLEDGLVLVDYEGNLNGASNLDNMRDRIIVAAGRHAINYPTIARASMHESSLKLVGTICTSSWEVSIDCHSEYNKWASRYLSH